MQMKCRVIRGNHVLAVEEGLSRAMPIILTDLCHLILKVAPKRVFLLVVLSVITQRILSELNWRGREHDYTESTGFPLRIGGRKYDEWSSNGNRESTAHITKG